MKTLTLLLLVAISATARNVTFGPVTLGKPFPAIPICAGSAASASEGICESRQYHEYTHDAGIAYMTDEEMMQVGWHEVENLPGAHIALFAMCGFNRLPAPRLLR